LSSVQIQQLLNAFAPIVIGKHRQLAALQHNKSSAFNTFTKAIYKQECVTTSTAEVNRCRKRVRALPVIGAACRWSRADLRGGAAKRAMLPPPTELGHQQLPGQVIWRLKNARKPYSGRGSAPDPTKGASSVPPDPLVDGEMAGCPHSRP